MLRGELYRFADDPDLIAANARAQRLVERFNATQPFRARASAGASWRSCSGTSAPGPWCSLPSGATTAAASASGRAPS